MGLRSQFNIVLTIVFLIALVLCGLVSHTLLQHNARQEVIRIANVMIETARAIRSYTVSEVRPELEVRSDEQFLPETIPAYAATTVLGLLPEQYSEFGYKEATLNPTNPRNRATDWEADLIAQFVRDADLRVLDGERSTPSGRSLFIARPIKIANQACLVCHSVPENAPASMIKVYGDANGFGWKLNEIIGAQVVSVPMSVPIANANRAFLSFMTSICIVFVVLYATLNVMLSRLIIVPVSNMAVAADDVSRGDFSVAEFDASIDNEIGRLSAAFNRMRRSLEHAMKMMG